MTQSLGRFETAKASQYLQQLCKHFSHKTEAAWTPEAGTVTLGETPVALSATEGELTAAFEAADAEATERLRGVIDRHLARFAFREEFERMDWTPPTDSATAGG